MAAQVWVAGSQASAASPQFGVVRQATHVLLAVSQYGLRPEQVVSSTHATQLCVVVSQAAPPLLPTQLALHAGVRRGVAVRNAATTT